MSKSVKSILAVGFEQELYKAAKKNLADKANPLRFNNYAYAIRELARHLLHRLAPERNVKLCSWFRPDPKDPRIVTRRQRAQYAIQGGLTDKFVSKQLKVNTDPVFKALGSAITSLNKYTHVEESVFGLSTREVEKRVKEIEAALEALCSNITSCRRQLIEALWERIDRAVIDEALRETILEIDELATHHSIDEIYTADVTVEEISHDRVVFSAEGTISVELQWGSNSDRRKGDGVVMDTSFPFAGKLWSPVNNPSQVEVEEGSLIVDTSSWRD